jgi:KDO2-lipid IV(A) lauroyltransferase
MGQETVTMTGAAALACKLDMAVAYLRFECREDGGYRMTLVPLADHAGSHTPEELIGTYYKMLDEDLQRQPWNYLWTHKRWK